ncbi:MAG: 8-amino-7-oxononanoate synthase [Bacteroidota bacterium]
MNIYQKALAERKRLHLKRHLPILPEGIDFFSNDYLGLARSSKLEQKIAEEAANFSLTNGATGSRLLSGNSWYAENIEAQVAEYHNSEAALIYPSGYTANLGLISCLATKEVTMVMDELLHASLIDGSRLGKAPKVIFKHNDVDDLAKHLEKIQGEKLVVVESVYSMDGDLCPITEVAQICKDHQAMLIVDEAHAIGVFGKNGEGLVQGAKLEDQVMARIITYGKAPGIHGAAVVGPNWLKDYQANFSRSLIFSTAPSPHQFASIAGFYQILPELEEERQDLKALVKHFIAKREKHQGVWLPSPSHIQSIIVPGNEKVVALAEQLQKVKINALPIRKPSVKEDQERIRICLHSFNTKEEIDLLFEKMEHSISQS